MLLFGGPNFMGFCMDSRCSFFMGLGWWGEVGFAGAMAGAAVFKAGPVESSCAFQPIQQHAVLELHMLARQVLPWNTVVCSAAPARGVEDLVWLVGFSHNP
jgi:hypothetical protein